MLNQNITVLGLRPRQPAKQWKRDIYWEWNICWDIHTKWDSSRIFLSTIIYPPPSNDPRIRLSHITERTEGTESLPVSGISYATTVPARPRSAFVSSGANRHSRSSTEPSDLPPPGRANQLIGLFESGSSSRSPSPTKSTFTTLTRSQTPSNLSHSRLLSPPDRPSTATGSSYTPSTFTNTQSTFTQTTLSPSTFTTTQTGTITGITGSSQDTQTTPTSTLRRPTRQEGSPRSPLTNVRNIVALWKERTPTRKDNEKKEEAVPPVSPTPVSHGQRHGQRGSGGDDDGGLFWLRRRASGESLASEGERISNGSNGGSNIDISELGKFLGGNGTETPLHLGTLYYLNVHAEPPIDGNDVRAYCRAPLGRAVVQLDLVNCFAVESALSLSHPRERDDVGAIAAREQDALSQSGVEIGLIESLVPFWMVYGDGVERLACDSLVQREAINTPPTPSLSRAPSLTPSATPSFSSLTRTITRRSGSPTSSIRTIMSMDSSSSVSSTASKMSGGEDELYASESDGARGHSSSSGSGRYYSLLSSPSVSSSGSGVRRRPSTLILSYHSRTGDDTVIDHVYPGDSRVISGRRTSTRMSLRRSGSMTDLGSDVLQSNRSSGIHEDSDDQYLSAGTSSSVQRTSVYSSAESFSSRTGTGTGTRTFTGLTSTGITGTGTYTRTGT
ncbi:hypothetical protein FB446DRAFT_819548 [Lentinula raphanica]|nr:hypothetical protein FB446DRAFT_819548 [Lentinula raphanica]